MRASSNKVADKILSWLSADVDEPREFPLSNFERVLEEIRPCDVLLVEGRNRVGRVIRLITHSPWTHAALYIGRLYDIKQPELREKLAQYYQGDPDEQLLIESTLENGVVISPVSSYEKEHIRICRPKGLYRKDAKLVIAYAINQLGIRYDVRQILDLARFLFPWSILPRRWRSSLFQHNAGDPTHLSCPSLIARAFASVHFPILPVVREHREVGLEFIQRNPRLYTPSDFDYSPFFDIVKYPIIEITDQPTLHYLPWTEGAVSEDDEGTFLIGEEHPKKSGIPAGKPAS